jgi:peptide/nickel transport system permease protein
MSAGAATQLSGVTAAAPRRASGTGRLLLRSRLGVVGLALLSTFIVLAVIAPVIAPYDPLAQIPADALQSSSRAHLLGTDQIGRDVLSRVLVATRVSLVVGVVAALIGTLIGVPIGLLSGYIGGVVDEALMRAMDALYSFPSILLAMAVVAAIGPGALNVMIAVGITTSPVFARLVRAQVLSVREMEYVTAARSTGAAAPRLMVRHILPNVVAPVIVQASLAAGFAVLSEASLSYLGVGIRPPAPTWGGLLREGFPLISYNPWLALVPGMMISLLVLGLNFLGDALRDILDPRVRSSLTMRDH